LTPYEQNVRGTSSPAGYALARLGHSIAHVKIWGLSIPYGPKYGLPKKALWVGTSWPSDLRGYWTKIHQTFFTQSGRKRGRKCTWSVFNVFIRSGVSRSHRLHV